MDVIFTGEKVIDKHSPEISRVYEDKGNRSVGARVVL